MSGHDSDTNASDPSHDETVVFEVSDPAVSPKKRATRRPKSPSTSPDSSPKRKRVSVVRKERNRLHAKNSRHRRKQELDALRQEAAWLREENSRLHELLASSAPCLAEQLCNDIASTIPSTAAYWRARLPIPPVRDADNTLLREVIHSNKPFIFLDTPLPGKYILYVSPTLETTLGYHRLDLLGKEWSRVFGDTVHQFYISDTELRLNEATPLELQSPTSQLTHTILCTLYAIRTNTAVLCYMCVFGSK